MDYTIVELEEQIVIGLATRTANDAPDCGQKIGGLWQALMADGAAQEIPGPIMQPYVSYGLYYDYDFSDSSYEVMVGLASSSSNVPANMKAATIPAGKYAKFSIVGDPVKDVGEAWSAIWEMDLPRSFTTDFEAYLPGTDMQNAAVDIYIALK